MCGLFGRISIEPKKIDITKMNVLGVANDERGGDSVGIFIDKDVEYGVGVNKLYLDFMTTNTILKEKKEAKVLLGHTRKASVGGISEKTAQPILLRDRKNNVKFAMVHNGTIFNYTALALKYIPEVDIKGLTDSQVMALIFYHCGYNVLEEYQGAGVFIIADYRENAEDPKIYFFKGASKKYSYSKENEEERPLYMVFEDDEIWFSSLYPMLDAVSHPNESSILKPNKLVEVITKDDHIEARVIREIDRSNSFQYKDTLQNQNEYGTSYKNGMWVRDYQNGFSYDNNKSKENENAVRKLIGKRTSWITSNKSLVRNKVSLFSDGCFYWNDNLVNGTMALSDLGYRIYGQKDLTMYSFFEGRLLPSNEILEMIEDIQVETGLTKEEFASDFPEVLDFFSYMPAVNIIDSESSDAEFIIQKDLLTSEFYSGSLLPLFCSERIEYIIKDGRIHQSITGSSSIIRDREKAYLAFVSRWESNECPIEFMREMVVDFIAEYSNIRDNDTVDR